MQEELPNLPDTVVFHVGTNDIKNNIPLDTIMERVNVTVRMISSKSKEPFSLGGLGSRLSLRGITLIIVRED